MINDEAGIWTMTDAEYKSELARAWDEGGRAALEREHAYGAEEKALYANPYRSQ